MDITRYLNFERIVELSGGTFEESIRELLSLCDFVVPIDDIVHELVAKENAYSSYVGNNTIVPNLMVRSSHGVEIFVGRCRNGIKPVADDDKHGDATIVALVLAPDSERDYLRIISSVVGAFQNADNATKLSNAGSIDTFKDELANVFKESTKKTRQRRMLPNEFFLRESVRIAHETRCSSVMLFGDINFDGIDTEEILDGTKVVHVVYDKCMTETTVDDMRVELKMSAPAVNKNWVTRLRSAILLGVTRDIISFDDKICCVGCNFDLGTIDTVVVVDVQKELRPVFGNNPKVLNGDIKPEVLERTVSIALELAAEGREGKPVGCMFVIGNTEKISLFSKPLVLNPFSGHPESERNILNPLVEETVKEYSLIDGAFVIRGDGVIESAGTLIYTQDNNVVMPSGYGTRHAAAASISWAAECIAIAISESTRAVTLFRDGKMLQL